MNRPTPYTDPPDVYETPTIMFYCEDCRINFEVAGELVGDRDDYEFAPAPDLTGSYNVYCPNDKASDDYDDPTHDISMEVGQ